MAHSVQDDSNSINILEVIVKWFKPLAILGILAAVTSAVVSLLIQEKFESTVVMFPAHTNSLSRSLFSDIPGSNTDLLQFGEEDQAEQMLQILNSDEIRQRITETYDLYHHYEIEPDEKYRKTKLIQEWKDNVTFKRTEYQSVKIEVLDKSPDTAAFIANDIANFLDSVKTRMQKERAIEAYKVVEVEYQKQLKKIKIMEDSLKYLRDVKGVLEFEIQVEQLTDLKAQAMIKGNNSVANQIQRQLDTLGKYGGFQVALREQLMLEWENLVDLREKYEQSKVDVDQVVPSKFVVDRAFPAEKKTYPIRWLIVAMSVASTLFLAIVVILIRENVKKFI
ncbi:MAG: hypothetical protein MRY83_15615 [Flavobacteriales bacterium]|nr:hypothetical protein [Flavobacteriales bacterium]